MADRYQTEEEQRWYGQNGMIVQCPVPGCGHFGSFISKIHCRMNHGMERHEVESLHGYPKQIRVDEKWGW